MRLLLLAASVWVSACQAQSTDVPALIDNPTAQSRAELLGVVREALNGRAVTLAQDALTRDSLLIIEPKHLTGHDLRRPEHFQLVLNGSSCVLIYRKTEVRLPLTETTCVVEWE